MEKETLDQREENGQDTLSVSSLPEDLRFKKRDWIFLAVGFLAAAAYFFAHFPYVMTDQWRLPGIGFTATQLIVMLSVVVASAKSGGIKIHMNPGGVFLGIAALGLGLCFSFYGDLTMRAMNLPVTALVSILAVYSLTGKNPLPALSGAGLRRGLKGILPSFFVHFSGPLRSLQAAWRKNTYSKGKGAEIGLGVLLGMPAVMVALLLLGSADQVFASIVNDGLNRAVHVDGSFFLRFLLSALFALTIYSFLVSSLDPPFEAAKKQERQGSAAVPCVILSMIAIVYALFVFIQFRYLFSGTESVRMSGGYAEYARSGFFQLVILSMLTLLLVYPCLYICGKSKPVRALCGAVSALTILIDVSAYYRMKMYIEAYGLSVLRVVTLWGMGMILAAFLAALIKCAKPSIRVCAFLTALALGTWLFLNAANVDKIIADYQVSALNRGITDQIDIHYLRSLSPAVLPSLERIADDEIREQAIYETKDYFLHNPPKPYDWDFSWFGISP